jgi:predicted RNA-binding Zn ribbon-like protein
MDITAASDRFGAPLASDRLRLCQELANSVPLTPRAAPDLLADAGAAGRWLGPLARQWSALHHVSAPDLEFTEADVARLRALRSRLRALLSAEEPGTSQALLAPVTVRADWHGVSMSPAGRAAAWVESAVAGELLLASEHGELRRLKLCRNPACAVAFYDRSKNNSRVWHNLARCGTPMHVRAYRDRQRGTPPSD